MGETVNEMHARVKAEIQSRCENCAGLDESCMECDLDFEEGLSVIGELCECKEEYGVVCRAHQEEAEAERREEHEREVEAWDKYGMGLSWEEWQELQETLSRQARG